MSRSNLRRFIRKIIADAFFKQRFIKSPKQVLKEEGIEFPESIELKVLENSEKCFFVVIPERQLIKKRELEKLPKHPSFEEISNYLITCAQKNKDIKNQLLENPKKILLKEGFVIPEDIAITVCENTNTKKYIIIPKKVLKEISEAELTAICGGRGEPEADFHIMIDFMQDQLDEYIQKNPLPISHVPFSEQINHKKIES